MRIRVNVAPNAKRSEVVGWEDDPSAGRVLRVRIAAPPVEGKANRELEKRLAEHFGVPKSRVRVVKGEGSKRKLVELPDAVLGDGE